MNTRSLQVIVLLTVCIVLLIVAFRYLESPWVPAIGTTVLASGALAYACKNQLTRALWVNLAVIMSALGAFEIYLLSDERGVPTERFEGTYTTDYYVNHDILGYGPANNISATVSRYVNDELIYDLIYTIDDNGLRATSLNANSRRDQALVFFGGSVTFGEGVSDHQSMPYRVRELVGNEYEVYNFGFHGYGPHQMLAAIELGLLDKIVREPVKRVVYQAIPAHVARAAGLAHWDRHGPRYTLDSYGLVTYTGSFDGNRPVLIETLLPQFEKLRMYQHILGSKRAIREDDINLYLGIVKRSRSLILELYPEADFHVLLWGYKGDRVFDEIEQGFATADIRIHLVSDILPAYDRTPHLYTIHQHEPHPNPLAHDLIARYVVANVVP